jgi:hypothetical protein
MTISALSTTTDVQALQSQPQHRRRPPSMDNTAQLLGLSTDDLQSALKSGQTLDDLASSKGVSSTDLTNAITSDIQANKPADAPQLSDDQLTQMAASIAAGKGPGGAHRAHHHQRPSASDADPAPAPVAGYTAGASTTASVDGGVAVDTYA